MPVVIDTPIPSVKTVAQMMGVSPERVKEIERMVEALPSPKHRRNVSNQRARKVRGSARPRSGRRS
jgi:hypothetical protein